MAVFLNSKGVAHARALLASGKVNESAPWSFSAADSDALLGDPPKWPDYGLWFLGHDPTANPQTKDAWKYPFGKGGTVYRSALRAIASRAAQQNETEISKTASEMIASLDTGGKAYSILEIKSVDPSTRVIEGIASTPTVDRYGDSMDPMGAKFTLPMPFLWEHKTPIGEVFAATPTPDGINIKARISSVAANAPAALKDRLAEAWHSMTATPPLVRGLSIGWAPIKSMPIAGTKFQRIAEWVWGETSAVVVPANTDATITAIKSFDRASAASGSRLISVPAARGTARKSDMTISQQVQAEQATLQTKSTRFEELLTAEQTNGGLEADETTERDGLETEINVLTKRVARLKTLESAQATQAKGIDFGAQATHATPSSKRVEFVKKEFPKATHFIRMALAIAAGKGSRADSIDYAKRFTDTPEIPALVKHFLEIKADPGTAVVASPGWGGELVNPNTAQTEFVELLMPMTIIGQVPNFRRVPFNIPIITQTGGSTFEWVGEGKPKPVGEMAFERTTMPWSKAAGIVVLSEELARLSTPSAEALARTDMTAQAVKFLDERFIQASFVGTADNPASITYNVSGSGASGTDADALKADLMAALQTFTAANIPLTGLVIVTTPDIALGISLLTTTLGTPIAGFNVTPTGGTLLGYPVIVSESVDSGMVVIFKPSEIFLADEGQVRIDSSNQATLDMSGSTTATFSLWQNNCVGLRVERWINWKKRRSSVVMVITGAAYGPQGSA